jgi:hypothetical protein
VVAGRTEEAVGLFPEARDAVLDGSQRIGWFTLEVARSVLQYQRSEANGALEILSAAQRHGLPRQDDARKRMADGFKASFLLALDRFDEAYLLADGGLAAAQKDRQNWALRMFETWKGRQLLQRGQLAEAAVALEGRFNLENSDRIVGREAPNVVALGKLKIHGGDDVGAREIAEIAKLMVRTSAPAVQGHGAWYLALHAMSQGKADEARDWLSAFGYANRLKLFPLYPFEIEDDPQLVRIAVAVGDGNWPIAPSSKQSVAVSSTLASSLSRQPPRTREGYGKARRTNCRARSRSSRPGHARWQRRRHSKISDACRPQRAPPLTQFARSIAPWRSTRRSAPAGMRRGYAVGLGSWAFGGALPFRSAQSPVGKL